MNCTTTGSTGSRRGLSESPCRRSRHRRAFLREPLPEETNQVWTEAGFLPPAGCRRAVALLHRLAMNEESAASLLSPVLTATTAGFDNTGSGYQILDPAQLRRTAEDCGIDPAGRSDAEVARAVALAIIGEYGDGVSEEGV